MVLKRRFDNEEGSIQGLVLFFLMIIFSAATYFWLTLPMTDGVATAVTMYWTLSNLTPDAAYQSGFANIAALNDGSTIAMLVMILSGLSFLIVALRSKFSVG
jgi:hypothetical protein